MLGDCQNIAAECRCNVPISLCIEHRVEQHTLASLLIGAHCQKMLYIGVPVVAESFIQIRICLPVLCYVQDGAESSAFLQTGVQKMLIKLPFVIAKGFLHIRIVVRIILCIENIFQTCCGHAEHITKKSGCNHSPKQNLHNLFLHIKPLFFLQLKIM